jgi:hypothetical protein
VKRTKKQKNNIMNVNSLTYRRHTSLSNGDRKKRRQNKYTNVGGTREIKILKEAKEER